MHRLIVDDPTGKDFRVHRDVFREPKVFDQRAQAQHTFFGSYEHLLASDGGTLIISEMKIFLLNDVITGFIDFYCV